MLNNAGNLMSMLVLSVHPCACVVKYIDVHGGRHSTDKPADVELYFLLGSHQNRVGKSTNHRKARTETHNKVIIRDANMLKISLTGHQDMAQNHSSLH